MAPPFQNHSLSTEWKKFNITEDTETRECWHRSKGKTELYPVFWTELSLHMKQWENTSSKGTEQSQKEHWNIYWTLRLKSNLQELGAHGCVLSSPSPDPWHRRHLPSPWYSCYKIYVCIWFPDNICHSHCLQGLSCPFVFPKCFFYQNYQKSLHSVIDLCHAAVLVTFMHWRDLFFFWQHYTAPYFLPQNSHLIHLKWLMCDQQFTSRSKRCNIWSFARGMSTASQRSIMFCSPQSCHTSTPCTSSDNLVPKQLQVSSFWGVKSWKHLKQISRDCSPLNLWIFLYSVKKKKKD